MNQAANLALEAGLSGKPVAVRPTMEESHRWLEDLVWSLPVLDGHSTVPSTLFRGAEWHGTVTRTLGQFLAFVGSSGSRCRAGFPADPAVVAGLSLIHI